MLLATHMLDDLTQINGDEVTAGGSVDWCRYTGVEPAYIDPGSPWQTLRSPHGLGRCGPR